MDRTNEKYQLQLEAARSWKRSHPERHAELARAYRARNREKSKAQNKLNYAIRMGRVNRLPCEGCGTIDRVHAHHEDYSKPYDVKWLCFLCHKKVHPVDDEAKKIKFQGAKHASLAGERNPNASLTNTQVLQIRAMLDIGLSQQQIARAMGVTQTTISGIKLRKRYVH